MNFQTCSTSNRFSRFSPLDMEINSNAFMAVGCSSFFSVTWCSWIYTWEKFYETIFQNFNKINTKIVFEFF